ncbi:MAG TPA: dual specificity protein phosphatase 23 [Fimbriiglobus sp.]|jgi:atypical dual specificity phosphatase
MPPSGFSWVDEPHLAGLSRPGSADDLRWLRQSGIDVLISLTVEPLPRPWVNDAGLLSVHIPVPDLTAPTDRQFDVVLDTVLRAKQTGMGVAVHCLAGLGRTGTVLAAYFVAIGLAPDEAIAKVRSLRPGSIESSEQEQAVRDLARRLSGTA